MSKSLNNYVPEYAKGQILVYFKEKLPDSICEIMEHFTGYKLSRSSHKNQTEIVFDNYVYITEPGKEKEAMKEFMRPKYKKFVELVQRRDVKLENRCDNLEGLERHVRDLIDEIESSDSKYKTKLQNTINYIKRIMNDEKDVFRDE